MIDGLFAKDVLARRDCFQRDGGVRIGGGADQYSLNIFVLENFVIICIHFLNAESLCPFFRLGVHKRIGNSLDRSVFYVPHDRFAMHFADSACADNTNIHHKIRIPFLLLPIKWCRPMWTPWWISFRARQTNGW